MPSKATQAVIVKRRPARKVLVRVHFQNSSKVVADELVRKVSALPGVAVTSVRHSRVAYKLAPDGIPWVSIFISVKPHACAAGLYLTKKSSPDFSSIYGKKPPFMA